MSEPIKVGDLVQLVHECCSSYSVIGHVGEVVSCGIHDYYCYFCGWSGKALPAARLRGQCSFPKSWLKRIPPPSELEGEKRDEEITA